MRILVNATTCVVGGGVQVATAFIRQALWNPHDHEWIFAVSAPVMRNIESVLEKDTTNVVEISPPPARLRKGMRSRHRLRQLENEFCPDVVFTVFGPAYHKFSTPHVCGFADPWVTHRSKLAMNVLPCLLRCKRFLLCFYKECQLSSRDYYWVEAPVAQRGLMRILGIPEGQIKVIPNSYSDVFLEQSNARTETDRDNTRTVRVFSIAHPYPHKNLTIIPEVAHILSKEDREREYRFIVTLPNSGKEVEKFWRLAKSFKVESLIENAGRLKLEECPEWYARSDIVFMPTLLETFSATYPEAMKMGKPIVTTDIDFAHDICGDAAVYYSPLSAKSAASAVMKVVCDETFRTALIEKGRAQLQRYPTPEEKFQMQLDWIETVAKREK